MPRSQAATTATAFVTGALTNAGATVRSVEGNGLTSIVVHVPGLGLLHVAVDLAEEGGDACSTTSHP